MSTDPSVPGDGGWTFAHDNARKALQAEFGDQIITSYADSVPESADAERVMRDMIAQGNKMILVKSQICCKYASILSMTNDFQLVRATTLLPSP